MIKRAFTAVFIAFSVLATGSAKDFRIASPDGRTEVSVSGEGYSVFHDGVCLIEGAEASLTLADGSVVGVAGGVRKTVSGKTVSEHVLAPFYRQAEFDFSYNGMRIFLKSGFSMEWRVSDEGVAYRFVSDRKTPSVVKDETASFVFASDGRAWLPYSTNPKKPEAMAFQNTYTVQKISDGVPAAPRPMVRQNGQAPVYPDLTAFLPATVECGKAKVTILESGTDNYPGMAVKPLRGTQEIRGVFARYPKSFKEYAGRVQRYVDETEDYIATVQAGEAMPWRILAVTDADTQMPVSNLVYALAPENRIGDTSWIRPGFSAWEWWNDWQLTGVDFKSGINMDTYRHYVDFASENGLEYVILDEGWYTPSSGNMLETVPELDLPELVAYAEGRNVKLILWCVFNVLDDQLEEACRLYSGMGIAGFKVDFLDRDDQEAQQMTARIAAKAAEYRLILDYHGISKPAGLNRAYPNIVNYEAIFGQEEVKWSEADVDMPLYNVTAPFIRMMAGYTDYTPGSMRNAARTDFKPVYSKPMTMGTRAHQVALYIVYDSPLTMLCDSPSLYRAEQESTDFIASLPRIYDSEKVLSGRIGEHVVIARKAGDAWYVGGLSSWEERELSVDFGFLGDGEWDVELFRDGVNASRNGNDYAIERFRTSGDGAKTVRLASGGGFAMKITKTTK